MSLCFCLGLWRRAWFSLKNKVGAQGSEGKQTPYIAPGCDATSKLQSTTSHDTARPDASARCVQAASIDEPAKPIGSAAAIVRLQQRQQR